ncbi:molybdate ABC transporter substrate-binding protein [Paenibacillus sp. LHD-117]|uniref:molybdate ABC transporter substrate-binding protein n=1 Tax=Paenibacillus sp. LHD-117 TaxID=3071412 RepID=UPI0027DF1CA6|nr:molybdate ABC transporter substrate-binding protein [Paenibacillus sp. LHD-117]MDQ6419628.1 molybdate ABC transporter substrate-binding protein [Paenibacillus sp. LHD-117]
MREKRKIGLVWLFALMMALALSACGSASNAGNSANANGEETSGPVVQLTISAAASLTDALEEIKGIYESQHTNVKLLFNFGASGALQTQIEEGAPADLFLSASPKNMKALVDGGFIEPDKQMNLLGNELVVVVPADSKLTLSTLQDLQKPDVKRIAIGIPESVPAGNYAKEALTKETLWDALQPVLVQAKDVRQVLSYVETGNVDAGFVYRTDALSSTDSKVAFAVAPGSYAPIQYPAGIVKATEHPEEAAGFYDFLQSKEALDVFVKYGFSVPE